MLFLSLIKVLIHIICKVSALNFLEFTTFINTLSVAIANGLSDEELAIFAAVFTQIGDTLATISVAREISPKEEEDEGIYI